MKRVSIVRLTVAQFVRIGNGSRARQWARIGPKI
jgi:hypothetical protein